MSCVDSQKIISNLHDPITGRLDAVKIQQLLACSQETISTILDCDVPDLQQNSTSEILQEKLQDLYIFIGDALKLIESGYELNEMIASDRLISDFREFLNAPHRTLNKRNAIFFLINRDFEILDRYLNFIAK